MPGSPPPMPTPKPAKKNLKKPAVKDGRGKAVLIDTIAAWDAEDKFRIMVFLRSGQKILLEWDNQSDQIKAREKLEAQVNFI